MQQFWANTGLVELTVVSAHSPFSWRFKSCANEGSLCVIEMECRRCFSPSFLPTEADKASKMPQTECTKKQRTSSFSAQTTLKIEQWKGERRSRNGVEKWQEGWSLPLPNEKAWTLKLQALKRLISQWSDKWPPEFGSGTEQETWACYLSLLNSGVSTNGSQCADFKYNGSSIFI